MNAPQKAMLYISTIGTLTDLVFGIQTEATPDELEHALILLGLDATRLLYEQPLIQTMHEVCVAFGETPMNKSILNGISDENAKDD
jgi:hypothetical protein